MESAWFKRPYWDGSSTTVPHRSSSTVLVDDFGELCPYRRCAFCRRWLPTCLENFTVVARYESGVVKRWDHACRPCRRQERREYYGSNPEQQAKTKQRQRQRRLNPDVRLKDAERKRNRKKTEKDYERDRQHYWETRNDPVKWQRRLEGQRVNYWLRKEREKGAVTIPPGEDPHAGTEIIGEPIFQFVSAYVEAGRRGGLWTDDLEAVGELGISDKTLREWRARARRVVRLSTVDRILVATGRNWFDVYQPPSNGHKDGRPRDVLKYIADAEEYFKAVEAFTGELTLDYV